MFFFDALGTLFFGYMVCLIYILPVIFVCKVCIRAKWPIRLELILVFVA